MTYFSRGRGSFCHFFSGGKRPSDRAISNAKRRRKTAFHDSLISATLRVHADLLQQKGMAERHEPKKVGGRGGGWGVRFRYQKVGCGEMIAWINCYDCLSSVFYFVSFHDCIDD